MTSRIVRLFPIFLIALNISGGYGIAGGFVANITNSPHQVGILYWRVIQCGGGIIDENHILTAAHCVVLEKKVFETDILILSGSNDLYDFSLRQLTNEHSVSMIIAHPDYRVGVWGKNDVAILKLKTPIFFSSLRQPIALPNSPVPYDSELIISGWGVQSGNQRSRYLRSLEMYILPLHICEIVLSRRLDKKFFCGINYDIHQGIGKGDSGSLAIQNGYAVGIVFGGAQEFIGNPCVFNRIYDFLPWIEKTVERY